MIRGLKRYVHKVDAPKNKSETKSSCFAVAPNLFRELIIPFKKPMFTPTVATAKKEPTNTEFNQKYVTF